MTVPNICPECHGRRGHLLGAVFLACQRCGGRGWIGEGGEEAPPPAAPVWEHRMWSDPVVAAALRCRYCFGARTVVHVDEGSGTLHTIRCPDCAGSP